MASLNPQVSSHKWPEHLDAAGESWLRLCQNRQHSHREGGAGGAACVMVWVEVAYRTTRWFVSSRTPAISMVVPSSEGVVLEKNREYCSCVYRDFR